MLKRNNTSAYKTLFKLISPTRYIVLYIAENLLNEADEDDEIVDVIIDEDGSIITVAFLVNMIFQKLNLKDIVELD